MTLFIIAFATVQLLGLLAVLMAVRHAPVGVETGTGFHAARGSDAASAAVVRAA